MKVFEEHKGTFPSFEYFLGIQLYIVDKYAPANCRQKYISLCVQKSNKLLAHTSSCFRPFTVSPIDTFWTKTIVEFTLYYNIHVGFIQILVKLQSVFSTSSRHFPP